MHQNDPPRKQENEPVPAENAVHQAEPGMHNPWAAHDRKMANLELRLCKIEELRATGLSFDEAWVKTSKRRIGARKPKAKKDQCYIPQTDKEIAIAAVRAKNNGLIAERAIAAGVAVLPIISKVPQSISWTRLDGTITDEQRAADVEHWRGKKEGREGKDPFGIGSTLDRKTMQGLITKAGKSWMRGELAFGYSPGLSGAFVVDSDDQGGAAFIKFCADHGEPLDLDKIPITISASGGWHFAFANPDDIGNYDLKKHIMADIKARGGMCVLPGMVLPAKLDADGKSDGKLRVYRRRHGSPDLFRTIAEGGLLPIPQCVLKLIEDHGEEQRDRNDPAAESAALSALATGVTSSDVQVMLDECLADAGFLDVWENGLLKDSGEIDRSRTRFSIASRLSARYGMKLDVVDLKLIYDECLILEGAYDDRAVYRDYEGTGDTRESAKVEGATGVEFGTVDDEEDVEPIDPLAPADYVAAGMTTPPPPPPAEPKPTDLPKKPKPKVIRKARYDDQIGLEPLEIVEVLIENLMIVGEIVIPAGAPGAGKSADLLHLSRCIAAGRPYHGRETSKGGVIFASSENVAEDERRIVAHRKFYGDEPGLPFLHLPQPMTFYNAKGDEPTEDETLIIKHALGMEQRTGFPCKAIFIDNLRRLICPGDTSKEPDVTKIAKALERIRDATGATIVLIAHTVRDGDRYAGSGAIASNVDSVWHYEVEVLPGTTKGAKKVPAGPAHIRFDKLRLGDRKQKIILRMDVSTTVVTNNKGKPIFTVVSADPHSVGAGIVADMEEAKGLGSDPVVKSEPAKIAIKVEKPIEPSLVEKQRGMLLEVLFQNATGGRSVSRQDIEPDLKAKLTRRKLENVSKTKLVDMLAELKEDGAITVIGSNKTTRYILTQPKAA